MTKIVRLELGDNILRTL